MYLLPACYRYDCTIQVHFLYNMLYFFYNGLLQKYKKRKYFQKNNFMNKTII